MALYNDKPLNFSQQIALLQSQGLTIANEQKAKLPSTNDVGCNHRNSNT